MKKITFITIVGLFMTCTANAQSINESEVRKYNVTQEAKVPFRLFPTSNSWTFLKLDTRTGQIWGLQYSIESLSNSFTYKIDDTPIEAATSENIGRFTLYPTANLWTYILLDQINGSAWQVQYSTKDIDNCFRVRIW